MQNGFELHDIKHTSASSINLFAAAPDVWVAEKLFGKKSMAGPAAQRGVAIEGAVVDIISRGRTKDNAIEDAIARFNKATAFCRGGAALDKEREVIKPCVEQALEALLPLGTPYFENVNSQNKIELLCKGDGWELPVIGYLDLVYPQHGLVVDLKTTLRMPSEMSEAHQRQAAIYRKASGNSAVKFLYVTPKKFVFHECEAVDAVLADVKYILNRQERFLRVGPKELLRDIVHVQHDSFYWNSMNGQQDRMELYGI